LLHRTREAVGDDDVAEGNGSAAGLLHDILGNRHRIDELHKGHKSAKDGAEMKDTFEEGHFLIPFLCTKFVLNMFRSVLINKPMVNASAATINISCQVNVIFIKTPFWIPLASAMGRKERWLQGQHRV